MVGAVRHELGVEEVHEAVRAVVDREAEEAHIVRVEHPVREADALPLGHELRCATDHLLVPGLCVEGGRGGEEGGGGGCEGGGRLGGR